ncbi:MAG: hypothetical protein LCH85_05010 [Chloroflexi bacterium]|nr:hypothetical protein [Chloroflexota bacterium]
MQPFLLDPKNAAVVTRQKPYGSGKFMLFMLLFSLPFLFVGCGALGFLLRDVGQAESQTDWNSVSIQLAFVVLFGLFGSLALYFFVLRPWRLAKALRERGQMLPGQIINARFEKDSDGDWNLVINYQFVSPQGIGITKTQSHIRNDLRNTPPPPANTPVVVMYADERNFTVL